MLNCSMCPTRASVPRGSWTCSISDFESEHACRCPHPVHSWLFRFAVDMKTATCLCCEWRHWSCLVPADCPFCVITPCQNTQYSPGAQMDTTVVVCASMTVGISCEVRFGNSVTRMWIQKLNFECIRNRMYWLKNDETSVFKRRGHRVNIYSR